MGLQGPVEQPNGTAITLERKETPGFHSLTDTGRAIVATMDGGQLSVARLVPAPYDRAPQC